MRDRPVPSELDQVWASGAVQDAASYHALGTEIGDRQVPAVSHGPDTNSHGVEVHFFSLIFSLF
jgi:hypothetical protein